MGCSPAKTQATSIYDHCVYTLDRAKIDSFDKEMDSAEVILKEYEEARFNFSSTFGNLITKTGSIALQNPDLKNSLNGLFYQTARDCTPDPFSVLVVTSESKPYIRISDSKNCSKSMNDSLEILNIYIEMCEKLNFTTIFKNVEDLNSIWTKNNLQWRQEFFNKNKGDNKAQGEFFSRVTNLKLKYKSALDSCNYIQNKLINLKNDLKALNEISKNDGQKKYYSDLAKSINEKNKTNKIEDNILLFKNYSKNLFLIPEQIVDLQNKIRANKLFSGNIKEPNKPKEVPVDGQKTSQIKEDHVENVKNPGKSPNEEFKQETVKEDNQKNEELARLKQEALLKLREESRPIIYENDFKGLISWNMSLRDSIVTPNTDSYAKCLCINYHENTLHFGTKSGKIHSFNLEKMEYVDSKDGHTDTVKAINYFNDKRTVISGGKDGKLLKWNLLEEDSFSTEFNRTTKGPISSILSIFDGDSVYVGSGTNLILYDMFTMNEAEKFTFPSNIVNLTWIKNERLIAAGLSDGKIVLFSHDHKIIYTTFDNHTDKVTGLTLCNYNGAVTLASCSKDKTIKLFNISEKTLISSFNSSNDFYPKGIIYCNDDKSLITIHEDGKFVIFNYLRPEKKKAFFSNNESISTGLYVGDSNLIILAKKNSVLDFFVSK